MIERLWWLGTDLFFAESLFRTFQGVYHMHVLGFIYKTSYGMVYVKCLNLTKVKIFILLKIFLGVLGIPDGNILWREIPREIYTQIYVTCITLRIFLDFLIKTGSQQEGKNVYLQKEQFKPHIIIYVTKQDWISQIHSILSNYLRIHTTTLLHGKHSVYFACSTLEWKIVKKQRPKTEDKFQPKN